MNLLWKRVAILCMIAATCLVCATAQDPPPDQLTPYLNGIGLAQLDARAKVIDRIRTRADAEGRKIHVRAEILQLIGGLPDTRGPLSVRHFGTVKGDGFRIEKISYDSQPGFHVTSNVYVPAASEGPFPAVLVTPGHYPSGKVSEYGLAANLARAGMLVLVYDPISEGERLQHFDPELRASKVGRPTLEHSLANVQVLLVGDHLSRYFIWDAMRGIDYLTTRPDVDAERIGAFGCSGGGNVTAYLAALDDRVKAAASACYITSFQELLVSRAGVQEAEQSIPYFLARGLDLADWVELAAPKPYAIVSTTEDFFPFAGAQRTYEEARHIYGLYEAADRLQWITGPGGHGALGPLYPQLVRFFVTSLKSKDNSATAAPIRPGDSDDLLCSPDGRLSGPMGGESVHSINRMRADNLRPAKLTITTRSGLERLQNQLKIDIRNLTAVTARPGSKPPVATVLSTSDRPNYRLDTVSLRIEPDVNLSGVFAVPKRPGANPAIMMIWSKTDQRLLSPGGDVDRLASAGHLVFAFQPRSSPGDPESSPLLGPYRLLTLRAMLVGRTIVGMRIDDTIRAMDWLCSRSDIGSSAITAYADGPMGVVLLHAAALDSRIGRVIVKDMLSTYRMAVEQPLNRNVSEIAIPGVLRSYDLDDVALAISPRPLIVINAADAVGARMTTETFRKVWTYVYESDRKLGTGDRIRVLFRMEGEPLPVP